MGAETVASMAQELLNSTPAINEIVINGFASVLRRAPTSSELQYWTNKLQTKQITQAGFVGQLAASTEFYNLARNSMQG